MYLDRAPKLTNLARGHLSVEARSEDPVDQSRSATGKKRPSKEVSTKKRETGKAGAITEGPRKERKREITGAPKGRSPREATRGIWTDSAPSLAALAPKRERPKKGRKWAPARPRRRPKTPFGSQSGQGLDAPSPPLLEAKRRGKMLGGGG